jgi:hypothetical protein
MIYNDSQTIHVSQNTGNPSNEGYGYENARETINDAIADLTGDVTTIVIWPGTYDEGSIEIPEGINVIGTNRELCIIANTQSIDRDSGERMFGLRSGCHIQNLTFDSGENDFNYACVDLDWGIPGVNLQYAENIIIENCSLYGYNIGLNGSEGKNIIIKDSRLESGRITLLLDGHNGCFVQNTNIECSCNYNGDEAGDIFVGARVSSEVAFDQCVFSTSLPSNTSVSYSTLMGCLETDELNTAYETHIVINNCIFDVHVLTDLVHTDDIFGIWCKKNGNKQYKMSLNNCVIEAHDYGYGPSNEVIGIKSDNTGSISVNNCIIEADTFNAQALNSSKIVLSNGSYGDSSNWNGNVVYGLDKNGLDSISIEEPSGRATNFREMVIQTWMRFYNKLVRDDSNIKTYDKDDIEITNQTYTADGADETVNKSTSV